MTTLILELGSSFRPLSRLSTPYPARGESGYSQTPKLEALPYPLAGEGAPTGRERGKSLNQLFPLSINNTANILIIWHNHLIMRFA
jgi:hypothetical protein